MEKTTCVTIIIEGPGIHDSEEFAVGDAVAARAAARKVMTVAIREFTAEARGRNGADGVSRQTVSDRSNGA